jgi:hypothetical protein
MEPKAGLEPASTRVTGDNPILRPVEKALNYRKSPAHALDLQREYGVGVIGGGSTMPGI